MSTCSSMALSLESIYSRPLFGVGNIVLTPKRLPSPTTHVFKVPARNYYGLRFYTGSNFRFSYWFLHGPYNMLLKCAVCYVTIADLLTPSQFQILSASFLTLTPSTPAVPNCCCSKGSAPYWSNPPFLIFDIRALWRQSARMSKIKNGGLDQYGEV